MCFTIVLSALLAELPPILYFCWVDIRETLLQSHSKSTTNRVISFVGADSERFTTLITLYIGGESIVSQRAAWPISYLVIENPHLIVPYYPKLIRFLSKSGLHPGIYRNAFRFLQFVDVPVKYEGKVLELALRFFRNKQQPVAIQAFALSTAVRIALKYPEIAAELIVLIQEGLPLMGKGMQARSRKEFVKLNRVINP